MFNATITKTFTKFVGDRRRALVNFSLMRFGLCGFFDHDTLDYHNYDFRSEVQMLKSPKTAFLYNIYSLALEEGLVFRTDAPNID